MPVLRLRVVGEWGSIRLQNSRHIPLNFHFKKLSKVANFRFHNANSKLMAKYVLQNSAHIRTCF